MQLPYSLCHMPLHSSLIQKNKHILSREHFDPLSFSPEKAVHDSSHEDHREKLCCASSEGALLL